MTPREVLAWDFPLVVACEGGPNCRMAWNSDWSPGIHRQGRVDSVGYIHYSRLDQPMNSRGLYRFLLLVAQAVNPDYRTGKANPLPKWEWLYRTHVWASKTLLADFGRRAPVAWSARDRERSWNDPARPSNVSLAYRAWANAGLRSVKKRTYLRRPVSKEEDNLYAEMRYNGSTYREIAEATQRSDKVVWSHLRARGLTG